MSQLGILQVANAFARHDHDIPTGQQLEVMAEGFANLTFEAVALHGELDALLADHQTQAGMIETVVAREEQDVLAGNLPGW
ncbi:hypothetical protein FQZ97_623840 [compost metagenome]